jgi:hypothetical protein
MTTNNSSPLAVSVAYLRKHIIIPCLTGGIERIVNMRKFLVVFLVSGLSLLASCNSVENIVQPGMLKQTNQQDVALVSRSNKKVSIEQAKAIAELGDIVTYKKQYDNSDKSNNSKVKKKSIRHSFSISDEEDTFCHVVNYAEGGFIVISADETFTPIVAYSDEGSFAEISIDSKSIATNKNMSLAEWLAKTRDYANAIKKGKSEKPAYFGYEWQRLKKILSDESLKSKSSVIFQIDDEPQEPGPPNCNQPPRITRVNPLIPCRWDQGCSYNDYFPFCTSNILIQCDRVWTGCVTVAVSQLMRRWQHPNAFNWSNMIDAVPPLTIPIFGENPHVAFLMKQVADNLSATYGCSGTGVQLSAVVPTLHNLGYNSANRVAYTSGTYLSIIQNLSISRPVILAGFNSSNVGHAWNCDGYEQVSYPCYSVLFFHMNWGWGGQNNGWYFFDYARDYTSCREAIINIAP